MSADGTTKLKSRKSTKHDWSRFEAMTPEQRHAAAIADPDARPMTEAELARASRGPQARLVRFRLKLSQEEFARRYRIPIGTLRDWEQCRKEPDAAALAYLRVISLEPEVVRRALEARPPAEKSIGDVAPKPKSKPRK